MKIIRLIPALLVLAIAFNSHADVEEDLPEVDAGIDSPVATPPAPPAPAPTPSEEIVSMPGTINIGSISRKSGGAVYRIQVAPSSYINRLQVRVNTGKVVIHDAYLVSRSNGKVQVRYFTNSDMLSQGNRLSSESLNVSGVSEMYFVMEAFDGEAGVNIAAETDGRTPTLTVYKPVPPPTSTPPSSGGSIGAIKVGSRIMDAQGNVGVVKEIFSNGKIVVELDDYSGTYIREASGLAVRVKCLDYVCPGVRAIDLRGNFGEVKETYSNGKVRMTFDNYSGMYIREARELGIGTKCVQNVCVSSRVMDARANVGTVKEMFHTGKARVQLDDYSGEYIREASDLGVGVRCLGGICIGNVRYGHTLSMY